MTRSTLISRSLTWIRTSSKINVYRYFRLVLLIEDRDRRHEFALSIYESSLFRVTHSYVIAELVGLVTSRRKNLSKAIILVEDILQDTDIRFIWVDEALTSRAIELLKSRSDKFWSLCDAVSFVVMNDLAVTQALTTDHHFEQAGFVKLLES